MWEKAKSQRKPLSASLKNFPYRKSSDFYICRFVCGARIRLIDNHCPSSRRIISPEDHERADRQQGSFRFGLRHSPNGPTSAHVNEIELLVVTTWDMMQCMGTNYVWWKNGNGFLGRRGGGEEWDRKQPLASYLPLKRLSLAARSYH